VVTDLYRIAKTCCRGFLLVAICAGGIPCALAQSTQVADLLPDSPGAVLQQQQQSQTPPSGNGTATPPAAQTSQPADQSKSPADQTKPPADQTQAQRDLAAQQLKEQEKQRVFGVMATFNTTNNKDALPLTSRQKYQLFFKSATDPWPFLLTAFSAGIDQAQGAFPEYGGGIGGYAKR
jgi:hypothetical protein